jgi:hypothetical protein
MYRQEITDHLFKVRSKKQKLFNLLGGEYGCSCRVFLNSLKSGIAGRVFQYLSQFEPPTPEMLFAAPATADVE